MRRAVIVEGRVLGSTTTYSVLGSLGGWFLGAVLGRWISSNVLARSIAREESQAAPRRVGEQTAETFTAAKEKASDAITEAKHKASDVITEAKHKASDVLTAAKERIGGTVSQAKERVPSPHDVSVRMDTFIRDTANSRPLLFALVPLCLGAFFAMLLPVSSQERRALSTAKQKVTEQLSTLSEKVENRIGAESGPKAQPGSNDGEPGSIADDGAAAVRPEVHMH